MTVYDYGEHAAEQVEELGGGELTALTNLARELEVYDADIEELEERLRSLKEKRRYHSEVILPDAMEKCGIGDKLVLRDGAMLRVQDKTTASISKERAEAAHAWLRANGYGDLIKHKVTLQFSRGQDNVAKAVLEDLRQRGLRPEQKEDVNYQTLGAFVREMLSKGADLPTDLLGVNSVRQASVVRDK